MLITDIIPAIFKIIKLVRVFDLLRIEKIQSRKINAETRLKISQDNFIGE